MKGKSSGEWAPLGTIRKKAEAGHLLPIGLQWTARECYGHTQQLLLGKLYLFNFKI